MGASAATPERVLQVRNREGGAIVIDSGDLSEVPPQVRLAAFAYELQAQMNDVIESERKRALRNDHFLRLRIVHMVSSATRYTVTCDVGEVGVKRDIDRIARVDLGEHLMNLASEGNDVTVAR